MTVSKLSRSLACTGTVGVESSEPCCDIGCACTCSLRMPSDWTADPRWMASGIMPFSTVFTHHLLASSTLSPLGSTYPRHFSPQSWHLPYCLATRHPPRVGWRKWGRPRLQADEANWHPPSLLPRFSPRLYGLWRDSRAHSVWRDVECDVSSVEQVKQDKQTNTYKSHGFDFLLLRFSSFFSLFL